METILNNGFQLKIPEKENFLLSYKPNDLQVTYSETSNTTAVDLYRWAMFWMRGLNMSKRILTVYQKPREVRAVLFDGSPESVEVIQSEEFKGQSTRYIDLKETGELEIHTLEGTKTAFKGDYVIKGTDGELYPCKPEVFQKTYVIVEG